MNNKELTKEEKRNIEYNKIMMKRVNELNEQMNKMYKKQQKDYSRKLRSLVAENKVAFKEFANSSGMSSDEYNESIRQMNQSYTAVVLLEREIKRAEEKRNNEYNSRLDIIIAEVDSYSNRQKNLNRARNNERVKAGLREGSIVKAQRESIKQELKTSSLKKRSNENRLEQRFKNKLQPNFRKPN